MLLQQGIQYLIFQEHADSSLDINLEEHNADYTFHTVHGVPKARILKWFPLPSPVDHTLSDLSTMTRPSWVAPHGMASFH